MAAPEVLRDRRYAQAISDAKTLVEALHREQLALVDHATKNDAAAHAALYEEVAGLLAAAANDLGRANSIMLNGDPEDYAR